MGKMKRIKPWPKHPVLGNEEKKAVINVLKEGRLSYFQASPGEAFYGGKYVKSLEKSFREYHNIKYAVAFNSATAALHAAVVACNPGNLNEVITTPYTFTSTATSIMMGYNIPIFCDIEEDTFNINPKEIAKKLIEPNHIKSIIPVHLFGSPCKMDEIMEIAKTYDLKVIEDCAQSPGAKYKGNGVGTIGDCGIFSLTETKNVTSGEGGVLITDNKDIAEIAQLIRNHGEAVIEGQKERTYKSVILGYNYRMTEIDAAIGVEQFKKLNKFNKIRKKLTEYLIDGLSELDCLEFQKIEDGCESAYHIFAMKYLGGKLSRNEFAEELIKCNIPVGKGYVKPLYHSPIYHENRPFFVKKNKNYDIGSCPIAEDCHFNKVINTVVARPPATERDMDDIINVCKEILRKK